MSTQKYEDYVFGYGSLVDPHKLKIFLGRDTFEPGDFHFCHLPCYRRIWNVAMDNRVDISGYKYYLDAKTGHRPDIFVTFLNVYSTPDTAIEGLLFAVSADELALLDQRERNYQRVDVSIKIEYAGAGRVWLYQGRPEAEQRYQEGLQHNTAVISRQYYQTVYEAFSSVGPTALRNYLATTDKTAIPLRMLKIVQT